MQNNNTSSNLPRYISPKDPLPILRPSLYFPPMIRSISERKTKDKLYVIFLWI
jgi:hypothetical protein